MLSSGDEECDTLPMFKELIDLAANDFGRAAEVLANEVAEHGADPFRADIERLLAEGRGVDAVTAIYLLAEQSPVDELIPLAEWAYRLAPGDVGPLACLADMRHRRGDTAAALALLATHDMDSTSDEIISKYCDFTRDLGRSFLGEALLRRQLNFGRDTLLTRLAEHYREGRNWRALRHLLEHRPRGDLSEELLYHLTRAHIGLLAESDVLACTDMLWHRPDPGPRFAQLLLDIWRWRIGDIETSPPETVVHDLPLWIARDAESLAHAPRRMFPDGTVIRSLSGWRALRPRENLPNVLGIGVQRAATTWLWNFLCRQPDVQPLPLKECVFFSDVFGSPRDLDPGLPDVDPDEDMSYWDGPTRNLFRYLRLFGAGFPVRADVSPSYAELPPDTIAVVRDLLGPDVKILLSLRDPVERCWSNLQYDMKLAGVDPAALTLADRIAHYTSDASLRRCDYAAIYRDWSAHFHVIKVVFYDDVLSRPLSLLAEIGSFLDLRGDGAEDEPAAYARVNRSSEAPIPEADRMFLLGLHRRTYDACEAMFGARAAAWRIRHERS